MAMNATRSLGWIILVLGTACGTAHADRIAVPAPQAPVLSKSASPYTVNVIDQHGDTADVYQRAGRFYVMGSAGQRYSIRVTNPTARRVEAVVSVDGLDVIDGKAADFAHKRGYVVPAHGELKIDGFRTSQSQVATFRFSSVSNSYAGRKGVARNVGVIGVALFEEKAAPEIIYEQRLPPPPPRPYPRYRDLDDEGWGGADAEPPAATGSTRSSNAGSPAKTKRPASAPSADQPVVGGGARPAEPARHHLDRRPVDRTETSCCNKPQERPGLGTEFGEQRYSTVTFTRFERANATTPSAIAELRYNDAQGLAALGIRVAPSPGPDELYLRETASPFPQNGFATPPPR